MGDRNEFGQFVNGCKGGPGRPKGKPGERDYLRVVGERCTLERWTAIVDGIVGRAEEGDPDAIRWLTKRLVPDNLPLSVAQQEPPTDPEAELTAEEQERMRNRALRVLAGEIPGDPVLAERLARLLVYLPKSGTEATAGIDVRSLSDADLEKLAAAYAIIDGAANATA
jgi:hypothetical protein